LEITVTNTTQFDTFSMKTKVYTRHLPVFLGLPSIFFLGEVGTATVRYTNTHSCSFFNYLLSPSSFSL